MATIVETVRIQEKKACKEFYHIPGAPEQHETVCGWTDVKHTLHDAGEHPPDCPSCIAIVTYCRNLRLQNGMLP